MKRKQNKPLSREQPTNAFARGSQAVVGESRVEAQLLTDNPTAPLEVESTASDGTTFPIAGIGASAGGLAAFETFFAHMPADSDTGIAFVIVQHLDPGHKSVLPELLRRYTRMPVTEAAEGIEVQPNRAYIIRPNTDLAFHQGKLHLTEPGTRREARLPIDFFFRSLAKERGEHAIGIILSGNGADGTLGLRAIKEAGGMAIVQEPNSAEYDGMPRSAICSGLADFVLPPEKMAAQLLAYVKRTSSFRRQPALAPAPDMRAWLLKIMALLRSRTGHDFSNYKQNTIRRRVERRMAVNQIETMEQYVRLLRQTPTELDVLFRELLIGVTGFFRDPAAFEAVRDLALPTILTDRPADLPVRVWVPGCSTGEEAYSLAMLIHEAAERLGRQFELTVFATDIDRDSVEKARTAIYPASIVAEVSPERLACFFTQEEKDFYRIKKSLRDHLIFAEQDVIKDPPFSKLDLISCRNMLIYMEPVLQKRLLPLFHYALSPGRFLLLGNSESVGDYANLFSAVERRWKLYRRKDLPMDVYREVAHHSLFLLGEPAPRALAGQAKEIKPTLREMTERVLLRNYVPACVAVNERGEVLHVHGRTGKFLELPSREAGINIMRAAREGLKSELTNALRRVVRNRQPVRCEGLRVRTNGGFESVTLTVELAEGPAENSDMILVTFLEEPVRAETAQPSATAAPAESPNASQASSDEKDRQIMALERELRIKTEALRTTIEELETSNAELKSTNEELKSINEELETSTVDPQSGNQELVTINTELQQKIEGLARANNDMNNLLASTGIGMLFVDHQLRIQRFTPAATRIINLIQTDIGRPVSDLVSNLVGYDRLSIDVKAVLDSLIPREAEVQTRDNKCYLMRILPYRTIENVIEGAVLTFVDIAPQQRAEGQFRQLGAELDHRAQQRAAQLEQMNLRKG